jgi:hypothetical protein
MVPVITTSIRINYRNLDFKIPSRREFIHSFEKKFTVMEINLAFEKYRARLEWDELEKLLEASK